VKLSPQKKIEHLNDLKKHKGWQLLLEVMQEEIDIVTQRLVSPNSKFNPYEEDVVNHQRGMVHASRQFTTLPDRLILGLENHIKLTTPKPKGTTNGKSARRNDRTGS
jgi:hypothetical protein